MLRSVKTIDRQFVDCPIHTKDNWIMLTDPTPSELILTCNEFNIELDFLRSALDPEESSRIEVEDNALLIIVNAAVRNNGEMTELFDIIPIGILILDDHIVTVSRHELRSINWFLSKKYSIVETEKKTRFTLQLINQIAAQYLSDLNTIDHKTTELENALRDRATNNHIIELLKIEKTLVYFRVNLSANEKVLKKISRLEILRRYEEDAELLEDAIIEIEQAIEMSNISASIIQSIREAFSTIANNNLNAVMKTLAVLTLILSIPTIIFSFFGMNVKLYAENNPYAMIYIILVTILLSIISYVFLKKKGYI